MKSIKNAAIIEKAKELIVKASFEIPRDILSAIRKAYDAESSPNAKMVLGMIIKNAETARREMLPLCQDCGNTYIMLSIGKDYGIEDIYRMHEELQAAIRFTYRDYNLRTSVVDDPLFERKNTSDNTPGYISLGPWGGKGIKLKVCIKGGGSENCSYLFTENPGIGEKLLVEKICKKVSANVTKCCPPAIIGVGIGSSASDVLKLARKASFRRLDERNADKRYMKLEEKILEKVNSGGIGVQGLGGDTTALACNIEYAPCHMATLPIGISLGCHSTRRAETVIF